MTPRGETNVEELATSTLHILAGQGYGRQQGMPDLDQGDPLFPAIRRPVETRDTEYKESQPLDVLKWKLVKSCMAMANLRGGGRLIIGVNQRSGALSPDGVHSENEPDYDQDDLLALVNRYARPPVTLTVRIVEDSGKRFIAIEVQEFERTPVMCGVPTPPEAGSDGLQVGNVPVRSRDRVATTRIADADLMAEVLEIAAEKRAAQIIATAQRIGLRAPEGAAAAFAAERDEFGDFNW